MWVTFEKPAINKTVKKNKNDKVMQITSHKKKPLKEFYQEKKILSFFSVTRLNIYKQYIGYLFNNSKKLLDCLTKK